MRLDELTEQEDLVMVNIQNVLRADSDWRGHNLHILMEHGTSQEWDLSLCLNIYVAMWV